MRAPKQKRLVAICAAVLTIFAATGTVYAYLSTSTGLLWNTFTAAPEHTISIEETFQKEDSNYVKKDVRVNIEDKGYAVYVRAAISVNWKKDNTVYGQSPVSGTDYSLSINEQDWFKHTDGFYYLKTKVTSGQTPVLINSCTQLASAPKDGYTLHVEIIAQTIQAVGQTDGDPPVDAVEDAWGIEKSDFVGQTP